MKKYIAHIQISSNGEIQEQTVTEHCRNTAEYAGKCLNPAGLFHAGYLAGLLHDAGKCKEEFQTYLKNGGQRGSINHTFTGCRMILEHFHGEYSERFEDVTAELLACAIASHHGLFDCVDPQRNSGFLHRMQKENIQYQESHRNFLACCADWNEIEEQFALAHAELSVLFEKLTQLSFQNQDTALKEVSFYIGLAARLLSSAVMEGDRRDTAAFMSQTPKHTDRDEPKTEWRPYLQNIEKKLEAFSKDTPLQLARADISKRCRCFAEKPSAVYRLNVPTGGGKTLSSLRYALAHAAKWKKKRIIFVTPLLSILEQNAKIIRDYIDDDSIILEHHSNIVQTTNTEESLDLRELAVDSWHAPVILTTMVQFLNTLFLGKTTSVRRFHALCDAVIVIDEVQTVPNHMLTLFNLAVNFLSELCGTTFLLCSATQPCFEQAHHPLMKKPIDVVPFDPKLWEPFCRTTIIDAGKKQLEEIPPFVLDILSEAQNILVVCNKKSEATFLYERLSETNAHCFHLSASMCMAHRRETLQNVYRALKSPTEKTICIATQVIEAGVDISFQRVIRFSAGMDSIVQAAGRCNRNGEEKIPAPVYIVQCLDENLQKMQEVQRAKNVTTVLLEAFKKCPQSFQYDLSSDVSIRWYYQRLYANMKADFQDYAIPKQKNTLFSMLGSNTQYYTEDCDFYGKYTLAQSFQTAGRLFHALDEDTVDVVVPYGEGEALINELAVQTNVSVPWLQEWSRRARPYTIALYEYQKEALGNAMHSVNGVFLLIPEVYDPQTGLSFNQKSTFLEV